MPSSTIIEITRLSKFYGKSKGITDVNLKIDEGEIFGFIGPNGAGKSTTIRILLNLIFPTSGSARIMGMDIVRETKIIKQYTGYIPSDAGIYPSMDVREFLGYCARFHKLPAGSDRVGELSDYFELDLNRRIADLSIGNRKKVAIVQSLLHSPRLLILDEPTLGLDPLMQAKFFDLLRAENKKGVTIFFSSHILNEVQMLCKRVAVIRDGSIIRVEEIDSLRKKQLKKVTIGFTYIAERDNFTIPGMERIIPLPGNNISFMYSGSPGDLIGKLHESNLNELTIEEPSLEEIFIHYYN